MSTYNTFSGEIRKLLFFFLFFFFYFYFFFFFFFFFCGWKNILSTVMAEKSTFCTGVLA